MWGLGQGKSTLEGVLLADEVISKNSKSGEQYTPDAMVFDLEDQWAAPSGTASGLNKAAVIS
jgi:hypothetical protein